MRSIAHFMAFEMLAFQKSYVLGEQYLFEQHFIRTMDGEDAVQKGILFRPVTEQLERGYWPEK
jgi:hypothetical protein